MNDDSDEMIEQDEDYFELDMKNSTFTIRTFYDQYLSKNKINLCPEYQREFVWKTEKQSLFIDSIMRSFPIPSFIMIKNTTGGYSFECIDGQHRLTVIKHFITGESLNDSFVRWKKNSQEIVFYEKNEITKRNGCKHKRFMTSEEVDRFNDYNISVCIINKKLSMDQIFMIFNRLQNGERMTTLDKLKNKNHQISDLLRLMRVTNRVEFLKSNIGKYFDSLFGQKHKSRTNITIHNKNLYCSLLMRSAIILTKNIDSITSWLDLNLADDIETKSERVNISCKSNKLIIEELEEFLDILCSSKSLHKIDDPPDACKKILTKHLYFVLLDIYRATKNKKIILDLIDSELFDLYNNDSFFSEKDKIPSPTKYIEVKNKFNEYIAQKNI